MKSSKNTISEWILKYGDERIERIVNYALYHNLKIEQYTEDGFIASQKCPVYAGMKVDVVNNKIISHKLRKAFTKTVKSQFKYFPDGDIVDMGIVS